MNPTDGSPQAPQQPPSSPAVSQSPVPPQAPASQQSAPTGQPPKPKKHRVGRILLIAICLTVVIPAVLVIVIFSLIAMQGDSKMSKLDNFAEDLKKDLSSLVIIDGQSTSAIAKVNGDMLTADEDPRQASSAEAALSGEHRTFKSLDSEIDANLSKAGFTREGTAAMPYYATSMSVEAYERIIYQYTKGDRTMRVEYNFAQSHECPEGYVCKHIADSKSTDLINPIEAYGEFPVTKINLTYTDKANSHNKSFNYY